jgi:hypothetical protein
MAIPSAWVFASVQVTNDGFLDRRRSQKPIWRDPDERWNWRFAQRILPHIPIAAVLSDPIRRDQFLLLCDSLIRWTIERIDPPWAEKGSDRHDRAAIGLIEWSGHLFQWLARVAGHLQIKEVQTHIVEPIVALDDDSFLALATPFCALYVCVAVYDAPRITAEAMEILAACRDRLLECAAWSSARTQHGDLYGRDAVEMLKDLLFDFDREALGSTRFANGDWSDVGKVIPLFDPIVQSVGDLPPTMRSFLNLCEKAKEHYSTRIFVEQVDAVLTRSDETPAGWHGTGFAGRLANLVQVFAERDHPLPGELQQKMLRILDRLVDMGDRRAAALQSSELFRNTRMASGANISASSSSNQQTYKFPQ